MQAEKNCYKTMHLEKNWNINAAKYRKFGFSN